MDGHIRIYEQGRLTFELRPTLTIIRTPLQAFYLTPSRNYWRRRLNLIRTLIEMGKIEDLNQLASWCRSDAGNEQIIKWEATNLRPEPVAETVTLTVIKV